MTAIQLSRSLVLSGIILAGFASPREAQIEFGGEPPSGRVRFAEPAATASLPQLNMLTLGQRIADEAADGPFKFGEVIPVELSIESDGVWETLDNGDRVWRLRIASRGAYSLMLLFSSFRLPEGGELFAYDDEREFVHGAYTHLNNSIDGRFAIQPIPGEGVTLEYYHPRGAERPELGLASVIHDYRGAFGYAQLRSGGVGSSEACEVDISCPEGMGWGEVAKSVVQITTSTGICCSGVLLNNTAGDGAAIVLTAAHCLDLDDAIFAFNFQRTSCGSGVPTMNQTVMGSKSLVMDEDLDLNLVRLDTAPPAAYDVRYAGWDRSDVIPSQTIGIHHPRGDVKKISVDTNSPTLSSTFWNLANWETGITEGGSSGSPLFEPVGQRTIGHLIMGASICAAPVNDFYGRFSSRWELLGPYLDPLNTGQPTTDLLDPSTLPAPSFGVLGFMRPIHSISPGTRPDQTLSGSGFTSAAQVAVDGVQLPAADVCYQGVGSLQLNLPLLDLGPHTLTVTDGAGSQAIPFDVVVPPSPIFQVGTGDIDQAIFSFVNTAFTYVGAPGDMQLCLVSNSLLPSSMAGLVSLEIGNNFSDLRSCLVMTVPATGHVTVNRTLSLLPLTAYYGQTLSVSSGFPVPTSNLQGGVFNF